MFGSQSVATGFIGGENNDERQNAVFFDRGMVIRKHDGVVARWTTRSIRAREGLATRLTR